MTPVRGEPARSRARRLIRRAIGAPAQPEPLTPDRLAWFWRFGLLVAVAAIAIDLGLLAVLRGAPHVDQDVLWTFAAINLPTLAVMAVVAAAQARRPGSTALVIPMTVAAQATVIVWVQVTGTLSSYFVAAGALLACGHRALLSWRYGVISVAAVLALHAGAFGLEEAGALRRAALFVDGPGPIYASAELRWSVMMSMASVYVLTWAGGNVLVAMLRETEGALARAQRRLAEVAEGARHGRLTGRRLDGRWRLLEVVGRGGMGEVYRAVAVEGGEEVAIKVLHPHLADDEHMLARFRREADVAGRVPPTVAPALLEARLAGPGDRYLAMEYLRGEDLAALLRRRGALPPAEAIALVEAAAAAIAELHARGIVHRDLKPHNLFVVDGVVGPALRLLDFGIARADGDTELTRAAQIVGTPGYIAPEHLVDGGSRLGPEADVFALAVIAFQLLTGQRPFPAADRGMTPVEPVAATAVNPALPADVDAAFALALARAPARRTADARAFAAHLRAAIDGALPDDVRAAAARLRAAAAPALEDTAIAERA